MLIQAILPKDSNFLYELYMDSISNSFLLYEFMTKDEFSSIIQALVSKKQKFIYTDTNQNIGMCKLIPQEYRNSHILYIGGIAIHQHYKGKGYGKKMLDEIVAYAKEKKFTRLELTVATYNTTAIKLYETVGFRTEGVLHKYTYLQQQDKYIDEQIMALLI